MNKVNNTLSKPPFFVSMFVTPGDHINAGQYSDAVATLASSASLNPGFLGYTEDRKDKNHIRTIYFDNYKSLISWLDEANDLLPYGINLADIIQGRGCLWKWLPDPVDIEEVDEFIALSA